MKKIILVFSVAGFLLGTGPGSLQGQETKPVFSLNLGMQTDMFGESSFSIAWFTLDGRLGIPLGQSVEIAPEIMAVTEESLDFEEVFLYPGLMVNYKIDKFFVGAGLLLPIDFYEGGSDTGSLSPKVNIGYRFKRLNLTAYLLTWSEGFMNLQWANFGLTIGYSF